MFYATFLREFIGEIIAAENPVDVATEFFLTGINIKPQVIVLIKAVIIDLDGFSDTSPAEQNRIEYIRCPRWRFREIELDVFL